MVFFLTIISDACGTAGGALVAVALLGLNGHTFFTTAYTSLIAGDVVEGLTKPLFSGFIIATIGCFYGLRTTGGTRGVGKATTQAVVVSSVLIILVDFLVTKLMIGVFGADRSSLMATLSSRQLEPFELDPAKPVVEFDRVSISFGKHRVLEDVTFQVARAETRIILGPAGGGKSVLMKLANGLLRPDSGVIRIFGKALNSMSEEELFAMRAHVGMVFQESALFDSLNVEDNVAYRLQEERTDPEEVHTRVVEALRFVELERAIDKFPSELSGGMRRRVSIARAIISGPDLILYDSPTAGLDPITSTTIIELVVKQRDVSDTTALLITHRLQDAFTLATHRFNVSAGKMEPNPGGEIDPSTRFLVLREGRVIFDGDTLGLTRSTDPWLQAYME